jgi:hypothetical protein
MTQKTMQNPWTMDVRVRERNLRSGALTEKDLEKYLGTLPDVADQAESFALSQPALSQPVGADDDDDDDAADAVDEIGEGEQP